MIMKYFDILDDGRRASKNEFSNLATPEGDNKNSHCYLWHYKGDDMEVLARFSLPVNLRSITNKLPNLTYHEQLKVFETGHLILSDTETIQIEPKSK